MNFGTVNMTDLMNSLQIMWKGMLGIFVVLIIISLLVLLLTKITNRKSKNNSENQ